MLMATIQGRCVRSIAVLAVAFGGCSSSKGPAPSSGDQETTSRGGEEVGSPETAETPAGGSDVSKKETPPVSNVREDPDYQPIEGAELPPLPEGIMLRFQHIYMGEGVAGNFRFMLRPDGSLFWQANPHDLDEIAPNLWGAPYPDQPTAKLDAAAMERVRGLVRDHDFFALSPGYRKQKVFGGDMHILEIRMGDKEHRVIVGPGVDHPVVDAIRTEIMRAAKLLAP